jgi:stage V sporulation protein D (sporulation-specific penicillin-binding protein)
MINKTSSYNKKIILFLSSIFSLLFLLLIIRLYFISVLQHDDLSGKAFAQQNKLSDVLPDRGDILDRNLEKLAITQHLYRIDLDIPTLNQTLSKKNMASLELSKQLSSILDMDINEINNILNKKLSTGEPASSAVLKRYVPLDTISKIKDLNIYGILISPDTKRQYVNNNFLAHVLGYINDSGNGALGVELNYNSLLEGTKGQSLSEVDQLNRSLPYSKQFNTQPINGKNIVLTIDEAIQYYAEESAQKALKDNNAHSVSITVMDPKSGEILAMATKPDFNPNAPYASSNNSKELLELWQNKSVQWCFEPGSIFKPFTAMIALKSGLITPNSTFTCTGTYKVANTTLRCWDERGHGTNNFENVLKFSCNPGFIQMGQRIGKDVLYSGINSFGFGQKTNIDLPGESKGIVLDVNKVGPVELATTSFGQGIATTQVEILSNFNAIANGGQWIQPHVMQKYGSYDSSENFVTEGTNDNITKKQIMDQNLTNDMRGYLSKVVSDPDGGAHKAYAEGLDIAGKTGTAQRVNPETGGYDNGKYVSSFMGMAPYKDPKITLIVTIDQPDQSNYYGGQTAAPIAKDLFTKILGYINK